MLPCMPRLLTHFLTVPPLARPSWRKGAVRGFKPPLAASLTWELATGPEACPPRLLTDRSENSTIRKNALVETQNIQACYSFAIHR